MDYKQVILDLSTRQEERIQAAFNLENIADDESIRVMAKAMFTDPSPIVRHECAFSLGETASPKLAGPYLMQAIENDPHVFVKHEALLALGTLGDKSFVPFIETFLKHPEAEVSESAEIALQRLKN
jgi:deoxyhypusine monooxygenase